MPHHKDFFCIALEPAAYHAVLWKLEFVYRRIFSRFEKLDLMFLGFISFVLVADGLRGLC